MVLVAAALFATIQSLGAAEIAPSRSAQSAEALPGPPAEAPTAQPANPVPDRGAIAGSVSAATVFDNREVSGILGREVRGTADENMGRIIDVIVDRAGSIRAAVAMQSMANDAAEWIRDRHDDEEGQTAVEYAGILALIATIFVLLFALKLDEKIKGVVEDAVNKITNKQ